MPEQPRVLRNLVIRTLWSIVSKAADRSSRDKIDTQPLSEAGSRSFTTLLVGRLERLQKVMRLQMQQTLFQDKYAPVYLTRM